MSAFSRWSSLWIYLFMYGAISGTNPHQCTEAGGPIDAAIPSLTAVIIASLDYVHHHDDGHLSGERHPALAWHHAGQPADRPGRAVVVVFVMTSLGMLLLIAAGKLVYHVRFDGNAFSVLGGFVLSSLSFFGIGFIWPAPCPRCAPLGLSR